MNSASEPLAMLSDPSLYTTKEAVAVFDEHTDVRYVHSETGKSCAASDPKAKKLVHAFTRKDLEKIAANCNARAKAGDLCPITIGHTDPFEMDEKKQPEIVGYASRFHVAFDRQRNKWMLYADYHIRNERYQDATTYPRTSVEYWPTPGEEIIDPIALLRRTPQRDLGQWVYSKKSGAVLRYSMENKTMSDTLTPAPAPAGEGELSHEAKTEQFMRHCFSHPHAAHFSKHYSMDAAPPPTEAPVADVPPQQHAAFPSATNGALPKADTKGEDKSEQYRKDSLAIQFSRMQAEFAALKAENATLEARRMVTQLEAEGVLLDSGVEVPRIAALPPGDREGYAAHVRKHYKRSPVSVGGFQRVPVEETNTQPPPAEGEPADDAHMDRALAYMRPRTGCSWHDAVKATKATK